MELLRTLENGAYKWMDRNTNHLIRLSLAIVYGWFGALKFIDMSPAAPLLKELEPWLPIPYFPMILATWEVTIALCILIPKWNRTGLILIALHMPGTILPFLLTPSVVFTSAPYGLTLEGQYIVKNLLLVASAMVLAGSIARQRPALEEARTAPLYPAEEHRHSEHLGYQAA